MSYKQCQPVSRFIFNEEHCRNSSKENLQEVKSSHKKPCLLTPGFLFKELCIYKDKHGTCEDYFHSHQNQEHTKSSDIKLCPRCLNENPKDSLFCNKCGFSFSEKQEPTSFNPQNIDGIPFIFDPLAGINPSDKIDDIEISEIAAFTKVNTPYYITIFKKN